jgi:hypothetical protein
MPYNRYLTPFSCEEKKCIFFVAPNKLKYYRIIKEISEIIVPIIDIVRFE